MSIMYYEPLFAVYLRMFNLFGIAGDMSVDFGYMRTTADSAVSPAYALTTANTGFTIIPITAAKAQMTGLLIGWRYEVGSDAMASTSSFQLTIWRGAGTTFSSVNGTILQGQDFNNNMKYLQVH